MSSGGGLEIDSGGRGLLDVIVSGGAEYVVSGAAVSGEIISSGGLIEVQSGASTSGVQVSSGGVLQLLDGTLGAGAGLLGGVIAPSAIVRGQYHRLCRRRAEHGSARIVMSGGTETLRGGGYADISVLSGGRLNISSGAVANGTTLLRRASEAVYSGGIDNGAILSSGATEYVE